MFSLSQRFWADDHGFIVSAELVLIATVGVIGLLAGLTCVRDAVTAELGDVARSIGSLNQSYCYSGMRSFKCNGVKAYTAGSSFIDLDDSDGQTLAFDCVPEYREVIPHTPVVPYVEPQVIPCPPEVYEVIPESPILPAPAIEPCCPEEGPAFHAPISEPLPASPCPTEVPCETPVVETPCCEPLAAPVVVDPCCDSTEIPMQGVRTYPSAPGGPGYGYAPMYTGRPLVW